MIGIEDQGRLVRRAGQGRLAQAVREVAKLELILTLRLPRGAQKLEEPPRLRLIPPFLPRKGGGPQKARIPAGTLHRAHLRRHRLHHPPITAQQNRQVV